LLALFVHFDFAPQPGRGYKGDDQGRHHRQESIGERRGVEGVQGIYGAGADFFSGFASLTRHPSVLIMTLMWDSP